MPNNELTEEIQELNGDENYESFQMPDGSPNEKYIEKLKRTYPFEEISMIPYCKFPAPIKANIMKKMLIGLFLPTLGILSLILKITNFVFLLICIFLGILILYSAYKTYKDTSYDNFIMFEGIIVDITTIGFLKNSKTQIIKISNNEKFLNIKLPYQKKNKEGLPITVYILKSEPIINSEYGPLVENIISYSFNVNEEKYTELFKENEKISASEYIEN